MNPNILGLILSYVFVFLVILIATVFKRFTGSSSETSRKIIHVVVGNWIFIALAFFTEWYYAVIGPLSFILINYMSYRYRIFKAMELDDKNPGTIYYSLSLTILTLITFSSAKTLILPYLGMMAMAWGDGFASIIGARYPLKRIRSEKSAGGTLAFILFSFSSCLIYLIVYDIPASLYWIGQISLIFALLGAAIELFSPRNADNLSVPLILGLLGYMLETLI
ncbi:MAG: hypothetical protein V2J62_10845 [candidate division KSB1 bacterium]|jgi:phytol kinase|nr:hypothetical protein [candidate division KSB1 bacterium]